MRRSPHTLFFNFIQVELKRWIAQMGELRPIGICFRHQLLAMLVADCTTSDGHSFEHTTARVNPTDSSLLAQ